MVIARSKALVDTNLLIYACLQSDPRCQTCRELLITSGQGQYNLFISIQNLAEMYPNLTGPKMMKANTPAEACRHIDAITEYENLYVLGLTLDIQQKARHLCRRYNVTRQRYYDMQLVATMLHHQISVIFTENTKDFAAVKEIEARCPF